MTQFPQPIPSQTQLPMGDASVAAPSQLATEAFAAGVRLEQLGIRDVARFHFLEYPSASGKLRSAAAESVEAVFTDGRPDWINSGQVQLIRLDLIVPAPFNPRHYVNREAMITLLNSMAAQGIHTPLDVSQHPEDGKVYLLSGHRRLWGANALALDLLPCRLDPRGILTEVQMREALIKYNEGQEKPAPIDRAQSIFEYIRATGKSQLEVATLFNISPANLNQMLRLLTLPSVVQSKINTGEMAISVGLQIARHPGGERAQVELAERALKEGLTARKVDDIISRLRSASALDRPGRHNKPRPDSEDRRKEYKITIPGAHPVDITVSSNHLFLGPEQIEDALHEVVNQYPIEFTVHHRSGVEALTAWVPPLDIPLIAPRPIPANMLGGLPQPQLPESLSTAPVERADERGAAANPLDATPYLPALPGTVELQSTSPGHVAVRVVTPRGELRSAAAQSIHAVFIDGKPDWSQPSVVQLVYRDLLTPHPLNPRKFVSRAAMEDTLESIRKTGMHTPVHISEFPDNPERAYLVGGHRRLYCSTKLGYDLIPCRLDPRGVLSEVEIREGLVRDNEGQEKPAPIDRARSYADYIQASKYTAIEAANRLGINFSTMSRTMRLLELPPAVQEIVNTGQINESVAHAILDHKGGPDAQVALAYRAVAQKLTAKQVREFVGQSRVSLARLSPQMEAGSVTDKLWSAGANRRIVVHLHSGSGALSRNEVVGALQRAVSQVQADRGAFVEHDAGTSGVLQTAFEGPSDPSETQSGALPQTAEALPQSEKRVKLADLNPRDLAAFSRIVEAYLPKFLQHDDSGISLSSEMAGALRREVDIPQLKRLGISKLEDTVQNARRWHKLQTGKGHEKIALGQLLEYWGTSLEYLRALPPSKKQIFPPEVEAFPLDITPTLSSVNRARAASEIRSNLESFSDAIELRVLTLVDADRLTGAHRVIGGKENPIFSVPELAARDVKVHPHLRWYISLWLRNIEGKIPDPHSPRDSFSFSELHGYFSYAMQRFLEITGGKADHMISKKQLQKGLIVYSGNIGNSAANAFGSKSVLAELKHTLETISLMYQERQGPFPGS